MQQCKQQERMIQNKENVHITIDVAITLTRNVLLLNSIEIFYWHKKSYRTMSHFYVARKHTLHM